MIIKLNRPTSLSKTSIEEFKKLYFDAKGVLLSSEDAERQGLNVIGFIATLLELDDQERS